MNVVERFVATGEILRGQAENLREVKKRYWPKGGMPSSV
ncbi:hypothetical protein BJ998_003598 [Kutzneria kofuensis]|uniref:Uncharacterized protein n=1 Tax=Kutzneria kofuensis TaxID=103725 RepID=A0A7W9NGD4_9PSEU|nr:hypothetical protein [Kutzneria kofuensis]